MTLKTHSQTRVLLSCRRLMALRSHFGSFGMALGTLVESLGPPWCTLGPKPLKNIKSITFWDLILGSFFELCWLVQDMFFQVQFCFLIGFEGCGSGLRVYLFVSRTMCFAMQNKNTHEKNTQVSKRTQKYTRKQHKHTHTNTHENAHDGKNTRKHTRKKIPRNTHTDVGPIPP